MNKKNHLSKQDYDYENDILYIIPFERNYFSSVQIGDLILDLDEEGKINGLEVIGASRYFRIEKPLLKGIIGGKVDLIVGQSSLKVYVCLLCSFRNRKVNASMELERSKPEDLVESEMRLAIA